MLGTTAGKTARLTDTRAPNRDAGNLATRKIWLPKLFYDVLPYFYVMAGFLAFFATLYISDWFWVLPHYLLFSVACVHLGILVFRRRHRNSASDA
jgi:hypothetical protein